MQEEKQLSVLFRGEKVLLPFLYDQKVSEVKEDLIEAVSNEDAKLLTPAEVKLFWKGKVLPNDEVLDKLLEGKATESKSQVLYIIL